MWNNFDRQDVLKLTRLLPIAATLLVAVSAKAQLAQELNAPPSNCCLVASAKNLADQLQDWNQLGRYYAANRELKKQPADPKRVVFLGDSITDGWRLEGYFPGKPYVNRGISGQVTSQMLVRMYPDVIDLKPAAMVVLAGTNDVARNNGPSTAEMIQENIMAITELAQQHGIKVLLCSILPVSDYPYLEQQSGSASQTASPAAARGGRGPIVRQRMTGGRPPEDILKLNAWMKRYAAQVNATYVDYFSPLVDDRGWMKDGFANDGLHPNGDGYKIMVPIVSAAIDLALR